MQSDERILTTHCGSLPRPAALSELLLLQEAGEPIDQQRLHHESSEAVAGVLRAQVDAGIDIVSDGEQPRVGFSMYVPMRMAGFGGESKRPTPKDMDDFPLFAKMRQARQGRRNRIYNPPRAVAEVSYRGSCEAVAVVGDRSRVIAGTDCGFATSAGPEVVSPDVTWAKLKSCKEGADIASRRLWNQRHAS